MRQTKKRRIGTNAVSHAFFPQSALLFTR
jgi:hypothetical protein